MNKYQKKVNKVVKDSVPTFKGTVYEGSYYTVRKELKAQAKKVKQEGVIDTKF